MEPRSDMRAIAFAGKVRIAEGSPTEVATAMKARMDAGEDAALLAFDIETSYPVEFDLRGTREDVVARLVLVDAEAETHTASDAGPGESDTAARRTPGRPKLGVVAREVTLLPRHWEWLASRPGGASVTLRKLVEQARRESAEEDRVRLARESAYRFMAALAGDEPGFEEASRALFAGDAERFEAITQDWPRDVRDHARALAFGSVVPPGSGG